MRPRTNRCVGMLMLVLLLAATLGCGMLNQSLGSETPTSSTPAPTLLERWEAVRQKGADWFGVDARRLILFAALGAVLLLLLAGLVYLLIRRGVRRGKHGSRGEARNLLSTGTALNGARYVILGPAPDMPGGPTAPGAAYEVRITEPLILCSACYTMQPVNVQDPASRPVLCPNCGAPLDQDASSPPVLIAREVTAEQYEAVAELLARQLTHPAIVVPLDVFMEPGAEVIRYYQIEPKVRQTLAATAATPQPLTAVLEWGASLARGLDYLHQHQVVLNGGGIAASAPVEAAALSPGEIAPLILLDDGEARWLCFRRIIPLVQGEARSIPQVFREDVRELATVLLTLASGPTGNGAPAEIPGPFGTVVESAVGYEQDLAAADFAAVLEEQRRELAYQEPIRLTMGARSDVGRMRKLNEDNLFVRDYSELFAPVNLTVGVAAVADGVGGHSAGDVASRLTVEALAEFGERLQRTAKNHHMPDPGRWIVRAAKAANRAVFTEREAVSSDMGCTLVMALFVGSTATLLNVGDSRAYRLSPHGINQVTIDHSLVQRLIEIGQLTPEEARHHPQKSIIYRVVGDTAELAYDVFEVVLQPGEALLFCSDGLSDMVEDHVLWQVWRAASSPDAACEQLVALANEAGGYDNITVVIAQISRG